MKVRIEFDFDIEDASKLHADELGVEHWMADHPGEVFEMFYDLMTISVHTKNTLSDLLDTRLRYKHKIESDLSRMLGERAFDSQAEGG